MKQGSRWMEARTSRNESSETQQSRDGVEKHDYDNKAESLNL